VRFSDVAFELPHPKSLSPRRGTWYVAKLSRIFSLTHHKKAALLQNEAAFLWVIRK
jgi:hypothetical protein